MNRILSNGIIIVLNLYLVPSHFETCCARVLSLFCDEKLSEAKRDQFVKAFYEFVNEPENIEDTEEQKKLKNAMKVKLPKDYQSLMETALKFSCTRVYSRIIPFCQSCGNQFDDTHLFCPDCIRRKIVSPLYHGCRYEKCCCHIVVNNFLKSDQYEYLASLQCAHKKSAYFYYHIYIPPEGVIADLLHFGVLDYFMGTDEESLSSIAKVCNLTKGYTTLTSKNMLNICKALNLNMAAKEIEKVTVEPENIDCTTQLLNLSQQFSHVIDSILIFMDC